LWAEVYNKKCETQISSVWCWCILYPKTWSKIWESSKIIERKLCEFVWSLEFLCLLTLFTRPSSCRALHPLGSINFFGILFLDLSDACNARFLWRTTWTSATTPLQSYSHSLPCYVPSAAWSRAMSQRRTSKIIFYLKNHSILPPRRLSSFGYITLRTSRKRVSILYLNVRSPCSLSNVSMLRIQCASRISMLKAVNYTQFYNKASHSKSTGTVYLCGLCDSPQIPKNEFVCYQSKTKYKLRISRNTRYVEQTLALWFRCWRSISVNFANWCKQKKTS
jgi:uncharacterized protein YlbG (UPF0298 family)